MNKAAALEKIRATVIDKVRLNSAIFFVIYGARVFPKYAVAKTIETRIIL